MTPNEYQQAALRTAQKPGSQAEMTHTLAIEALGLAGESGELVDHIKKFLGHGHDLATSKVRDEGGDVLWYLSVILWRFGVTLEEAMEHNVQKLQRRYPEGFSSERSINREDA